MILFLHVDIQTNNNISWSSSGLQSQPILSKNSTTNNNESSYQLLLQQQQLMLQWQLELKQKYPNANVHFVSANGQQAGELISTTTNTVDFIDIDAGPSMNNIAFVTEYNKDDAVW